MRRLAVLALLAATVLFVGWWQDYAGDTRQEETAGTVAAPDGNTPQQEATPKPAPTESAASRYDLSADEARGGHTLARHVGRTDAQLRERLERERGISAASTYTDRSTAERIVALTLREQATRVDDWKRRSGRRPNLALDYRGREVIGRTLVRGRRASTPSTNAVVVLRWDERSDEAVVLTSYPEPR